MTHLFQSGKFWLKFISFCGMAVLIGILSLHLLLQQIFSTERLSGLAGEIVGNTNRTLSFNHSNIQRSWLPRPTVTLNQISISRPDSPNAAVQIQSMKIGLAWQSLFGGTPAIEKWVVNGLDAELSETPEGSWSLADLLQNRSRNTLKVNRFIVENSRLDIHRQEQSYRVRDLSLKVLKDNDAYRIENQGSIQYRGNTAQWTGSGRLTGTQKGWYIPHLDLSTESQIRNRPVKLSIQSNLEWHAPTRQLTLNNTHVSGNSPFADLHFNAEAPVAQWQNNVLNIGKISGLFTAKYEQDLTVNSSFMLAKLNLRRNIATTEEFELSNSLQTPRYQTTVNLSGDLLWERGRAPTSHNLKVTTLQDKQGSAAQPRFSGLLNGTLQGTSPQNWQLDLKGMFDRHPASLSLNYTAGENSSKPVLGGKINLQKLILTPYLEGFDAQTELVYPKLLGYAWMPELQTELAIGSMTMPGLLLNNLNTQLAADENHISLSQAKADLYGGKVEAGLTVRNTTPLSYHLQQKGRNINIRPLLQDILNYHNISGNGHTAIDLTAQGNNRADLTRSLKGSLKLNVSNGAWLGIDISNVLQNVRNNTKLKDIDTEIHTPFRQLSLSSTIEEGISRHNDTELIAENFIIRSNGQTNLNDQTIEENLTIYNAANPKAKPIPLKISGPLDNPSVTVDFQRLTSGLQTPEERKKALTDALKEQWQWLKPRNNTAPLSGK